MKRLLVALGATREWLDPVRFLSNASSGKLGAEIARAAKERGWEVVVLRPRNAMPQAGRSACRREFFFETTADLSRLLRREFPRCDALVMAAAVADFRPARKRAKKLSRGNLVLRLRPTPDLLAGLARPRRRALVVGFSLETAAKPNRRRLERELLKKNCDLMIWNSADSIGSDFMNAACLDRAGTFQIWGRLSKRALAARLLRRLEKMRAR